MCGSGEAANDWRGCRERVTWQGKCGAHDRDVTGSSHTVLWPSQTRLLPALLIHDQPDTTMFLFEIWLTYIVFLGTLYMTFPCCRASNMSQMIACQIWPVVSLSDTQLFASDLPVLAAIFHDFQLCETSLITQPWSTPSASFQALGRKWSPYLIWHSTWHPIHSSICYACQSQPWDEVTTCSLNTREPYPVVRLNEEMREALS